MCGKMGAYTDVVTMPLQGRVRTIDRCISHIVAALNAGGVVTVACCCGHGKTDGIITLEDGRELVIKRAAKWRKASGASSASRATPAGHRAR